MLICAEIGSDVHALTKGIAIRRVEHRSEILSNESQHLAKGTEVARLWRRFSFVLQQALSFRTRHRLYRQAVALANTRHLRSQGPVSVHAICTEGVTGSKAHEAGNGTRGGIGAGGGNGDGDWVKGGNGDVNGGGDGDGAGTRTGVEGNEQRKMKTRTGAGTGRERGRSGDGSGNGGGDPWTNTGWERGRERARKREH